MDGGEQGGREGAGVDRRARGAVTDVLELLERDLLVLALAAVIVPAILLLLASPFAFLFWVTELAIRTRYRREWRRRECEVRDLRKRATRDPSVSGALAQHLEELLMYYEAIDDELASWEVGDSVLLRELLRRKYTLRSELAALRGTRHGKGRLDPSATPRPASRPRGDQRASAQGVFRPFGRGTVHSPALNTALSQACETQAGGCRRLPSKRMWKQRGK